MNINLASVRRSPSSLEIASIGEQWNQDFFAENKKCRHGSQAFSRCSITARPFDGFNEFFASEFLQVVRGLARGVLRFGQTRDSPDCSRKVVEAESGRRWRERYERFHDGARASAVDVQATYARFAHLRGKVPGAQALIVNEGSIHASQHGEKSLHYASERLRDRGKTVDYLAASKVFCVVCDRLDSKYAFAFAINLDCEFSEMHFENRQVIVRSLDHEFEAGPFAACVAVGGTFLVAENSFERPYVERGAGAVDHAVEDLVHRASTREEKVAAIFSLVDRVAVVETASFLLGHIQGETEARGVNPTLADLDHAPYTAGGCHGLCDTGQACGAGNIGKTIALFCKGYIAAYCLTRHVLVAIEHDRGVKRRVGAKIDGKMAPLGIHDVKRVVVDVGIRDFIDNVWLSVVADAHFANRRRSPAGQDAENALKVWIRGKISLCNLLLAFASRALDQRDFSTFTMCAKPPCEASRETHQMRVFQFLLVAHESIPPSAETAAGLCHVEIGVQNNSIHAIVSAVEKIVIVFAELVWHHESSPSIDVYKAIVTEYTKERYNSSCAEGATSSGRSPGRGVVPLGEEKNISGFRELCSLAECRDSVSAGVWGKAPISTTAAS